MLNSLYSGNRLRVDFSKVPKEIDVPKIVKAPKKWWKKSADTTIIVEKKQTSKTPIEYWVLNMIEC